MSAIPRIITLSVGMMIGALVVSAIALLSAAYAIFVATATTILVALVFHFDRMMKWNNDRHRHYGTGTCNDCTPHWCPCWDKEQERRRAKLPIEDDAKRLEKAC
jgi:hypothetical protein